MSESKIAQSVAAELSNPAGSGARHSQMKTVILSLLEIGLSARAIYTQFRGMYDEEIADSEIEAIIKWGVHRKGKSTTAPQSRPPTILTSEEATAKATAWLDGFAIDDSDLWDASEIRAGDEDDASRDSLLLLEHRYHAHELVTINARYHVAVKKDGLEKVTIIGQGETRTTAAWIEQIKTHGTPESRAGAWIRLNPMRAVQGSGLNGAHCDADVAVWRDLLVETDLLPHDIALSVYGKLTLPIAAIIDSAGRGPHAWVALNAQSAQEYAQKANYILSRLTTIGFDAGNSNPSRYGRLAGARRIIGSREGHDGFQRVLYLAPHPKPGGIFS
jgi:hypothetical protein